MTKSEYSATTGTFVGAGAMGILICKQPVAIIISMGILCIGLIMDFFEPWLLKDKWIPVSTPPEEGEFCWVTDGNVVFESFFVAGQFIAAAGTQVTHYQSIPKPLPPCKKKDY